MSFHPNIWSQLKNLTADEIISALKKDNWEQDVKNGAVLAFRKGSKRITIHYHPNKTYGCKLLTGLLEDIGWSTDDLKKLKLIKK